MHYNINRVENYKAVIDRQADTIHDKNKELAKCRKAFEAEVTKLTKATIESSNTIVRQAKQITQLKREKQQLTEAYNQLAIKLQSTERQLETMRACDADKARQLKGFHSENRRRLNMAVISPDRNFDSKPRKEG